METRICTISVFMHKNADDSVKFSLKMHRNEDLPIEMSPFIVNCLKILNTSLLDEFLEEYTIEDFNNLIASTTDISHGQ